MIAAPPAAEGMEGEPRRFTPWQLAVLSGVQFHTI
jgi:hypothetical protein